jgi:hypothetical protein
MSRYIGAALLLLASAGVAVAATVLPPGPTAVAAPEIDPASALSGLTLLLGALAVARGRRAK